MTKRTSIGNNNMMRKIMMTGDVQILTALTLLIAANDTETSPTTYI